MNPAREIRIFFESDKHKIVSPAKWHLKWKIVSSPFPWHGLARKSRQFWKFMTYFSTETYIIY